MQEQESNSPRRDFIQQSVMLSAGLILANSIQSFLQTNKINNTNANIKAKGVYQKGKHPK